MLSDLQRWLLRSSARSVGRELGGQVRRTLGGGRQQTSAADIWDTATNEIPPEVGEAPECQWCPICRAARRMRESGPGVGGQLSGVGEAVATVVQDAVGALDSILTRAGGAEPRAGSSSRSATPAKSGSAPGRARTDGKPAATTSGRAPRDAVVPSAADLSPAAARAAEADAADEAAAGRASGADDPLNTLAGEHGPGGWKPGDRLATEHVIDPDPWAGATEAEDGIEDSGQSGKDASASSHRADEAQLDGQGHGPDDRG